MRLDRQPKLPWARPASLAVELPSPTARGLSGTGPELHNPVQAVTALTGHHSARPNMLNRKAYHLEEPSYVDQDGTTSPSPLAPGLFETLSDLCHLPFVDPVELACIVDSRAKTAYRRLSRLEDAGLALRLRHGTAQLRPSSRYLPTAEGIALVAKSNGLAPGQFLRPLPLSAQWLRILASRIDSVAVIYRLASTLSVTLGAGRGPLRVLHQRHGPFDAFLQLPGGQLVGIVRQGPTLDRSALTSRLWTLTRETAEVHPGAILLVLHSEGDRRHIRRYLLRLVQRGRHAIHNLFMAVAPDVAHVTTDFPAWRLAYHNTVDLSVKDLI